MSADEFDPAVERLYREPQQFADSALFDAEVQVRLYKRSRMRNFVMGGVALVTSGIFLHQVVRLNLDTRIEAGGLSTILPRREVSQVMDVSREMASQLGLSDALVAGFSGPQLLIMCGLAATAVLASMAVRVSQSL